MVVVVVGGEGLASRDQTRGQRQRHTSLDIFRGWAPADDRNCHYVARGDV